MSEVDSAGDLAPEILPTAGEILREMRHAHGYSMEQLAVLTRLRPERIAALEDDDFTHAPYRAYIVGHIRVYARGLGEDPTPALDALLQQLGPPASSVDAMEAGEFRFPIGGRQLTPLLVVLGIVILAVALLLISRNSQPAEDPVVETTGVAAVATAPQESAAAPQVTLAVTATGDAFLEAIVDGQVVFSSLVAADEFHTWSGTESVRLKSDDGGALQIRIDGEPFIEGLAAGRELDRTWFPGN